MEEKVLLIFVRNPELGKVKTRLAATVGEENALTVYRELLRHTKSITAQLPVKKMIFYADNLPEQDTWPAKTFGKFLQPIGDLGWRMQTAFQQAFEQGAKQVVLIGSDCYELTAEILSDAFNELKTHDAVIGPAADGGYYLIGFSRPDYTVFSNKNWSTETVFFDTTHDLKREGLSYFTLPVLSDVDEEKDLGILRNLLT